MRHILFTDSEAETHDGWEVIKVKPRFPNDNIRSARFLKVMGPALFPDYEQSLWIDNTVFLKKAPVEILERLLGGSDVGIPYHSYRNNLAGEFGAVASKGYDDFSRIYEQLFHYQYENPELLDERVYWTGLLARKHTRPVVELMQLWWEHILRYSRRDQLSLNYAMNQKPVNFKFWDIDTQESEFHRWPIQTHRNTRKTSENGLVEAIIKTPLARLARFNYERPLADKKVDSPKKMLPTDLFSRLLRTLYGKKPASIVQIGVCDGVINDPIYELLRDGIQSDLIVLIEPQVALIDIIRSNYKFHPNAVILNQAIGADERLVIYQLKKDFHVNFKRSYLKDSPSYRVPAGFVSSSYSHVLKHVTGNLPDGVLPEDAIEGVEVRCSNLKDALSQVDISHIDVLQVDVEGQDDEVIYNSNLTSLRPKIIHYERHHLPADRRERLEGYLKSLGYTVFNYCATDSLATTYKLNIAD